MRFVIKNCVKTSHGESLYATFTYIVKDISEAKKRIAELIKLVRSVDSRMKGSAKVMKLLEVLSEIDKREEYDDLIIKVLQNQMLKEESEADCVAKISWWIDTKKLIDKEPIDFANSTCDISGMYFQDQEEDWDEETFGMKMPFKKATYNIWEIPLTKFEEYTKRLPEEWLDDSIGIVFSSRNY